MQHKKELFDKSEMKENMSAKVPSDMRKAKADILFTTERRSMEKQ